MPALDNVASFEILIALAVVDIVLASVAWLGFRRHRDGRAAQVLVGDGGAAATQGQMGAPGPVGDEGSDQPRPNETNDADAGTGSGTGLLDLETGLETSLAWEEALRHEEARAARYSHTATVVVFELEGLDRLADRFGVEVADRLIQPVAETLRRNSRAADSVARVGRARFHVLMPETDEIAAINYVDRIRDSANMWLEAGAVAVRVAAGWASQPAHGSLGDALRLADERLQADRRNRTRPRTVQRPRSPVEGSA